MIAMNFVLWWVVLARLVAVSAGAGWRWPEPAASVRIDTKVRFLDTDTHSAAGASGAAPAQVEADAVFEPASHTDGFYNRPAGAGRYPVRSDTPHRPRLYTHAGKGYEGAGAGEGTLDSLPYCQCVPQHQCRDRQQTGRACSGGMSLCCFRGHNKVPQQNTEYFNEIEDERPSLLPGHEDRARPFPPAPGLSANGVVAGPGHPGVLAGPGGPTGNIGPAGSSVKSPGVLIGPGGPTGLLGAHAHVESARLPHAAPDVLVGPGGPTGVIGPAGGRNDPRDVGHSESAQRGVLVGPGGPTGVIGPRGYGRQRPVLVGPGGPTGIVGPRGPGFFDDFFGQQRAPRLLVGPGGPTGIIGPGRQLLVGPGGPTGRVGPQNYFV